jgi:hypothetical protein
LLRLNLIIAAAAIGVGTGVAAWFAAGGAAAHADRIAPVAETLQDAHSLSFRDRAPAQLDLAGLATAPLFPLSVGPGAVQDALVRLDGISIVPRRSAALISIDGKPAEWLVAGDTRDGVTVAEVQRSAVRVDTVLGVRRIELGDPPAAPAAPPIEAAAATPRGDIPKGFRTPPPASAPRRMND